MTRRGLPRLFGGGLGGGRLRGPLVGALDAPGLYGAFAYGSRGLLWAGLAGELLASLMDGEPLPLEARLAQALAPTRFALRAARRRR